MSDEIPDPKSRRSFRSVDYMLWLVDVLLDIAIGVVTVWASIQCLNRGLQWPAAFGFFAAAFLAVRLAQRENYR